MESWHAPSCRRPDVLLSADGSMSSCLYCGAVCIFEAEKAERKDELGEIEELISPSPLSWPATVQYTNFPLPTVVQTTETKIKAVNFSWADLLKEKDQFESKPFVYDDLIEASHIRLLHLLPGKIRDHVDGWLETVDMGSCEDYDAISYTWADEDGDKSLCRRIFLGEDRAPLPISRNCLMALKRVRYEVSERLVWIDAVCINQHSQKERSHQVRLMHQVYSSAASVQIYAGEAELGNSQIGDQIINKLVAIDSSTDGSPSVGIEEDLEAFFSRPYFSRLWVVQEVLAAKDIHLHCGTASVKMTHELMKWLMRKLDNIPLWLSMGLMRKTEARGSMVTQDLPQLLAATSPCEAVDLRDKIFGLIGLISDATSEGLAPDYSLTVREVYVGLATYLLQRVVGFNLLQFSGGKIDPGLRKLYGIPTWVPLWNCKTPSSHANAGLETACEKFRIASPAPHYRPLLISSHEFVNQQHSAMHDCVVIKPHDIHAFLKGCHNSRPLFEVHSTSGALSVQAHDIISDFSAFKTRMGSGSVWEESRVPGKLNERTFFVVFPGCAALVIQGPFEFENDTAWDDERHDILDEVLEHISVIEGCDEFLLMEGVVGGSVRRVLGTCQMVVWSSAPGNRITSQKKTTAEKPRFLHTFKLLTPDTLKFMIVWHWLLRGDRTARLPISRRGTPRTLKEQLVVWADIPKFLKLNQQISDGNITNLDQKATDLFLSLHRFWQLPTIQALEDNLPEISRDNIHNTFEAWQLSTVNLLKYMRAGDIFDKQSPLTWSPHFASEFDHWGRTSISLCDWLKRSLQLDFAILTRGQYLVLAEQSVQDLSAKVHGYLKTFNKEEEVYQALLETDVFGGVDSTLMAELFLLYMEAPTHCTWLRYQRLVYELFYERKDAREITLI